MTDGLSKVERTRLALWALSEAEAKVAAPAHLEAEVMRAWDTMQAGRSRAVLPSPIPRERRRAAVVAKWVLVPAMALGMAWAAVRAVPPAAGGRSPSVEVAANPSADVNAGEPGVVESPVVAARPPSAAGAQTRAHAVASTSSRAAAPSPRRAAETAAGTSAAVVFVGELMGAGERIQVVRMRVPRSTLASLGISTAEGSDSVFVDLLVGEDGVARALQVEM